MYKEKVDKLTAAQTERLSQEGDFIDSAKIKDMLDQMVQIDSDPTSEKAKAYYKQLAQAEKETRRSKAAQYITIKTQRGGRKAERMMVDAFGFSMPPEQVIAERKRVHFANESYNFP